MSEEAATPEEILEGVRVLAVDLAGYNPGHGDYRTAGRWVCAILGVEPPS